MPSRSPSSASQAGRVPWSSSRISCNVIHCTGFSMASTGAASPATHRKRATRIGGPLHVGLLPRLLPVSPCVLTAETAESKTTRALPPCPGAGLSPWSSLLRNTPLEGGSSNWPRDAHHYITPAGRDQCPRPAGPVPHHDDRTGFDEICHSPDGNPRGLLRCPLHGLSPVFFWPHPQVADLGDSAPGGISEGRTND
jgi:hypothetical protein